MNLTDVLLEQKDDRAALERTIADRTRLILKGALGSVKVPAFAALLLSIVPGPVVPGLSAATLHNETIQAWDEYVQAAISRMQRHVRANGPFLAIDNTPEQNRRARAGDIVIGSTDAAASKVPYGLIHDWTGTVFIPNSRLADVFVIVRDYNRYQEFYRPTVIESKSEPTAGTEDRYSMILTNKAMFLKTALQSDIESVDFQIDDKRWYNMTRSRRVQEIENYGRPTEHKLPEGRGGGYIWQLFSMTKFEERDGGVYVELEAIALSRDIPGSLRWMVEPVVRRISRSSLTTTLEQTRDAVVAHGQTKVAAKIVVRSYQ